MANGHGGARPNAGRKTTREIHESAVQAAEKKIVSKLPQIVNNLITLANGGYERVDEEWQPAGLVMVGTGESQTKAFPDKPDDELVLVKRRVSVADKDRAANIYLMDRILGKPTQRNELANANDDPLEIRVHYVRKTDSDADHRSGTAGAVPGPGASSAGDETV